MTTDLRAAWGRPKVCPDCGGTYYDPQPGGRRYIHECAVKYEQKDRETAEEYLLRSYSLTEMLQPEEQE